MEKRAITKKYHNIFFNISLNTPLIIPFQLTHKFKVSSFNAFEDIAFTKFHPLFFKGLLFYEGRYFRKKQQHTHIRTTRKQYALQLFKVGSTTRSA